MFLAFNFRVDWGIFPEKSRLLKRDQRIERHLDPKVSNTPINLSFHTAGSKFQFEWGTHLE